MTVAPTGTELERAAQRPGFISSADKPLDTGPTVTPEQIALRKKIEADAAKPVDKPFSLVDFVKGRGLRRDDPNVTTMFDADTLADMEAHDKKINAFNARSAGKNARNPNRKQIAMKPTFFRRDGMTASQMAEALAEEEYFKPKDSFKAEGENYATTEDFETAGQLFTREFYDPTKPTFRAADQQQGLRWIEQENLGKAPTAEDMGIPEETQEEIDARIAREQAEAIYGEIGGAQDRIAAYAQPAVDEMENIDANFEFADEIGDVAPARGPQAAAVQQDGQRAADDAEGAAAGQERGEIANDAEPPVGAIPEQNEGGEGIEEEDNAAIAEAVKAAGAREARGNETQRQTDDVSWSQTHADNLQGTVVYDDGNLALIEGYSVLSGKPIYAAAKNGVGRTRIDVDSYTGRDFTPAELNTLREQKKLAVQRDADAAAKQPDGPFRNGQKVVGSKSIPQSVVDTARGWIDMLGIKARVFIIDPKDVRGQAAEQQYGLYGDYGAVKSAAVEVSEGGAVRKLPNGDYYIAIAPRARQSATLETLSHEIGHILEKEAFNSIDPTTKAAIVEDYRQFLLKSGEKNAGQYITDLRAHTVGKSTVGKNASNLTNQKGKDLPPYWRSFSEWFADQVSRWSTTDAKPLGVVDKFFKRIADGLRRLVASVRGQQYVSSKVMSDWLNGLTPVDVSNNEMPRATTEKINTVEGKRDQFVIPGAEQSAKQAAAARGEKIKPKVAQKEAGGLFAKPDAQGSLFMSESIPPMLGASGQPASKSELNSATALSTKGVPSEVDAPYKAGRDLATASRFTTFAQGVAAISPKFAKYMRRVLDQHYAERDLINRGETALRPAFELPDSSRPKINAVLEHDRLTGTDRTRFGQRVVVTMPANYQGTLAKPGQTITLSREETDGLRDIRKFLNDRWDDYGKAIASEDGYKGEWSKEAIQAELKKAEAEDTKDRGRTRSLQYVAEIYDMAQEKKRTGYVPFNRSGDVAITVREKPGREPGKDMIGSGEVKAFEMLDASTPWEFIGLGRKSREQKVNERVRELRKKYPADVYEIKANDVTPNIIKQLDLPAFEQIIMALNIKDESTRKQFFTEVLGEIRNQRKASFTRDSKNTPGYSTDFFQSLIDYNRVSSVVTSMITHGREIDQAYTATQSEPKNIKAFAERYKNYLDSDEAVIGRLKQFGFWANIWGSPSSAIVNLIQTPTITAAQIAGWGGKGTWADVNANLARVGRYVRADKDGAKLDFSKFDFKGDTVQAAAFQQAIREGVLDPGVSQDLMGDEPSRFGAGRDTQKFFGRVFKIGASMFNTAEQINRTVAWLSAYKQASKPDGVKRFLSMYAKDERVQNMRRDGRLEPADIARFVVEDTQFIGGKFDRPEALRGAGGIAFQFKQYPLNYMRLLWGNFSRMGKEGRTAGLIMIATMLALSGLLGLPFAEDVINMSDALGKFITKIDPMIERELRMLIGDTGWGSQGAEAILRGPSRMFGVDLSRRFGVGEIAPEADLLLSIPVLGATYGRMSEYFDRSARNQPIGAAGALAAPFVGKGPADVIRSVALAKEGLQTRGGDLKIAPDKTTLAQSAMKAVGLQPATVARVQEQDRNQQRLRYKTQDAENALRTSLASTLAKSISARKAGDTEKANAFLKQYQDNYRAALKAFRDEKVLEEKVNVPKPEALRDRALQMLNPDLRNKSAAKTKRKALADEDEFVSGRE